MVYRTATHTEHLLLGVMAADSPTATTLERLGADATRVESAIAARAGPVVPEDASVRWTQACTPIFETCLRNRIDHGGGPVGIDYLAVGLTWERYGESAHILGDLT